MPGVTSLGLRYPYLDETVDAVSYQNLATDVETAMSALAAKQLAARVKQTVQVFANTSVPAATPTTVSFNFNTFDTANLWSAGAPTTVLVGPGVWFATAGDQFSGGTITTHILQLIVNGSALSISMGETSNLDGTEVAGMFVATAASTPVGLSVRWDGTGGPSLVTSRLTVTKVRNL